MRMMSLSVRDAENQFTAAVAGLETEVGIVELEEQEGRQSVQAKATVSGVGRWMENKDVLAYASNFSEIRPKVISWQ